MIYPTFRRELASVLLKIFAVFLTIILITLFFVGVASTYTAIGDGECNVAVFPLEGVILPFSGITEYFDLAVSPRELRDFILTAENEKGIDAVLLEINSPGGTPVASEWMTEILKDTSLPTVALIGDMAASGGYMVASAADYIIASRMSDVGSIGVTMSYVDESKYNDQEGLTFNQLSSGRFKDAGNPNKELTAEERELFEEQLAQLHDVFVQIVSENRNLDFSAVQALADGSTLVGQAALDAQLVDALGSRRQVRQHLASVLEIETDKVKFCEYKSSLI